MKMSRVLKLGLYSILMAPWGCLGPMKVALNTSVSNCLTVSGLIEARVELLAEYTKVLLMAPLSAFLWVPASVYTVADLRR